MISLLIIMALIGLVAWALVTFVPMPAGVKTAIIIVAVVFVILIALNAVGIFPLHDTPVPQVR